MQGKIKRFEIAQLAADNYMADEMADSYFNPDFCEVHRVIAKDPEASLPTALPAGVQHDKDTQEVMDPADRATGNSALSLAVQKSGQTEDLTASNDEAKPYVTKFEKGKRKT